MATLFRTQSLVMSLTVVLLITSFDSFPRPKRHIPASQLETPESNRVFGSLLTGRVKRHTRLGLRLSRKRIPWGSLKPFEIIPQGVEDFHVLVNIFHRSFL